MKTMFIEAKCEKFVLPNDVVGKLSKELTIATSVQFIDSVDGIKSQLESSGIKVKLVKGKHSKYDGQILGCDVGDCSSDFLYIGDGLFHAKALLLKGASKVFSYNPFTKKLSEIGKNEIKKIRG